MTHAGRRQQSSAPQDLLADRNARLLLEHDEGGEAREQLMHQIPVAGARGREQRLEHLGKGEPCVEAIAARFEIERRVQRSEAREDRDAAPRQPIAELTDLRRCGHRFFLDAGDTRQGAQDARMSEAGMCTSLEAG